MQPYLVLVGIGCWITRAVAAANCLPSPIPIKVGNVTLDNGQVAWGAEISVGTPPQNFAFMPQWSLNKFMVYGSNGKCQDDSHYNTESCTTFRGGGYKYLDSTTCHASPPDGQPDEDVRYPVDKSFYTDTVRLNADAELDPNAATAQPEKPPDVKHESSDPALFDTHEVPGHPVARVSRSELA